MQKTRNKLSKQERTMRRWLKEFFMSSLDKTYIEKVFPIKPKDATPA